MSPHCWVRSWINIELLATIISLIMYSMWLEIDRWRSFWPTPNHNVSFSIVFRLLFVKSCSSGITYAKGNLSKAVRDFRVWSGRQIKQRRERERKRGRRRMNSAQGRSDANDYLEKRRERSKRTGNATGISTGKARWAASISIVVEGRTLKWPNAHLAREWRAERRPL